MGFLDLVSWLVGPPSDSAVAVTDDVRDLTERARSERLTPDLLAEPADRTNVPLLTYLADDEQPHYALRGTRLVLVDGTDTQARKHPTRILVVLVTDERVVFVCGGRFADDVYEVPLTNVTSAFVDEDEPKRHVVVEAVKDGDPMTFYADVTLEPAAEVRAGVEYVSPDR